MSLEIINEETRKSFLTEFEAATKENDTERASKALKGFLDSVSNSILREAKTMGDISQDAKILAARGMRVLTTEEKSYWGKVIECAKSEDSEKAFTGLTDALPETEVDAIFEDMIAEHPILDLVDCQNTAALMELIVNAAGPQAAVWGELNSAITKELNGAVNVVKLPLGKCTAFMYVSNDMLDLGPVWVEKYARTVLAETLGYGVEKGIIDGKGINGEPIGMCKNISSGVSVSTSTGYPDKTAVKVTAFDPETYGDLLSRLAMSETGIARVITQVDLFVNPVDYFKKVLPATTKLRDDGLYQLNAVPYPTNFVQVADVPSGKAILGLAKKYKFGIGTGKGGKIEADKSFKFLEDLTTLKVKLYGTGRALDNNCFLLLDISELLPLGEKATTTDTSDAADDKSGKN